MERVLKQMKYQELLAENAGDQELMRQWRIVIKDIEEHHGTFYRCPKCNMPNKADLWNSATVEDYGPVISKIEAAEEASYHTCPSCWYSSLIEEISMGSR